MIGKGHAHGDPRRVSDQRPGFRRGAESIVKNKVLEGHAHGDPPPRSDNETDGWLTLPLRQGHTVGKQ